MQLCARSSHGGETSKRAAAPANAIIVQLALAPFNNGLLVYAGLGLALREVRQAGRTPALTPVQTPFLSTFRLRRESPLVVLHRYF
jgi:hypothetical protein